jgi:hypothetical protein
VTPYKIHYQHITWIPCGTLYPAKTVTDKAKVTCLRCKQSLGLRRPKGIFMP